MYDIISVGSATMDVFVETLATEVQRHDGHADLCYHIGDKVLIKNLRYDTGGGGTNTAAAFARLGFKAGWLGKLGNDITRHAILESLKRYEVRPLDQHGTGLSGYSVILVGLQKDRTVLTYKGVNDEVTISTKQLNRLTTKWFYFSSMMGHSFVTQKRIAAWARKRSVPYAYNPSLYLAQRGTRYLRPIMKGATLIVMNAEEAGSVLGTSPAALSANAQKLCDYSSTAIITDGPRPTVACDGTHVYKLTPPRVRIVETTGAGDAFASGVVAGLMQEKPLPECLRSGALNAAFVIQHIGAKEGLLSRSQLWSAMRRHSVRVDHV